jgi:hypothetical protein
VFFQDDRVPIQDHRGVVYRASVGRVVSGTPPDAGPRCGAPAVAALAGGCLGPRLPAPGLSVPQNPLIACNNERPCQLASLIRHLIL